MPYHSSRNSNRGERVPDFDEYQAKTRSTAVYPDATKKTVRALTYLVIKLNGEAGEVAEKFGKFLRGDDELSPDSPEALRLLRTKIAPELGDVLWYVARLADEMGIPLEDIAIGNLLKLRNRQNDGSLKGSGDER